VKPGDDREALTTAPGRRGSWIAPADVLPAADLGVFAKRWLRRQAYL